ncbi:MAG TPA: penicillin-insensitive murein endopeptidase [Methylovirgula sp.]|nr:penicillin-insensitive murein endopeptidase [Methylovirgula sp.]
MLRTIDSKIAIAKYRWVALLIGAAALALLGLGADAQQLGTLDPEPLPPLAHPNSPTTPAKALFGRVATPDPVATRTIGFYARGCLAGAVALPVDGPDWQVMRLSRNRFWGTPQLIAFLERFAKKVPKVSNWPGILVGDMSQPRGGPMLTGHASHQIGLDVDIWLKPMPSRSLTREEREEMLSTNVVRPDGLDVDPKVWTQDDVAVIKAAAEDPEVQRIFVNAAIKKALCREARGERSWLAKVRPFYGHNYHFHVRLRCPKDQPLCEPQEPVAPGDGCSKNDLAYWFSEQVLHPHPSLAPAKPRPALTLNDLPAECRTVLTAK